MKTNMPLLRRRMKGKGLNVADLALLMGLSRSALYRRMQTGGLSFTIAEAHRLADVLELTGGELAEMLLADEASTAADDHD